MDDNFLSYGMQFKLAKHLNLMLSFFFQ